MKFGYFDDKKREYIIKTPKTPLPWINYLGSEDFFTLVSNTAGGYSFYKDARLRRLTSIPIAAATGWAIRFLKAKRRAFWLHRRCWCRAVKPVCSAG